MNIQELKQQIEDTDKQLQQLVSSFTEAQINQVPFAGSWTGGQTAEHILKCGDCSILYGNVTPTQRPIDEKIAGIRKMFLDYSLKFKAADILKPSEGFHNREELLSNLKVTWHKIKEAAATLDLSQTCTDFELPVFGALTRLEWINFIIIHTTRHIHQLHNIHKAITGA